MDESTQIKAIIGERIRTIRIQKQLTQKSLAELTGLNDKYISRVENGEKNITIDTLYKITANLDISLEDLFKGTQQVHAKSGLVINQIINLLQTKNEDDQKFIFDLLKLLLNRNQFH